MQEVMLQNAKVHNLIYVGGERVACVCVSCVTRYTDDNRSCKSFCMSRSPAEV